MWMRRQIYIALTILQPRLQVVLFSAVTLLLAYGFGAARIITQWCFLVIALAIMVG